MARTNYLPAGKQQPPQLLLWRPVCMHDRDPSVPMFPMAELAPWTWLLGSSFTYAPSPTCSTSPAPRPAGSQRPSAARLLLSHGRGRASLVQAPPFLPPLAGLFCAASRAQQQHCSSPCVVVELRHSPPHDPQPSHPLPSPKTASPQQPRIPSVSLACHPLDVLRSHIVAARCPSTCSPSVFSIGTAAPSSPRAAGSLFCGANGQHAVMPAVCSLFLHSPKHRRRSPRRREPRVLRGEGKPLDARRCRSDAQIGITVVLANADWVCLWTER
ncbi:uncharacterized protein [Zea mays]|uniref:uncharacterized protein n=1 Tax=Zea mays TaxID=4577 RepID=UPI0009AA923B|nr:uncharacterized protein LOC109944856 [Zea mays]|eukprot:XP_020405961.1 uncharacterized protein LOC109944856 [Zea mays]